MHKSILFAALAALLMASASASADKARATAADDGILSIAEEAGEGGTVVVSVAVARTADAGVVIRISDPYGPVPASCDLESPIRGIDLKDDAASAFGGGGIAGYDSGVWTVTNEAGYRTYSVTLSASALRQMFSRSPAPTIGCAVSWGSVRAAVTACAHSSGRQLAFTRLDVTSSDGPAAGPADVSARLTSVESDGDTVMLMLETAASNATIGSATDAGCVAGKPSQDVQIDPRDGIIIACSSEETRETSEERKRYRSGCSAQVRSGSASGKRVSGMFGSATRVNWCESTGEGVLGCRECVQRWIVSVSRSDPSAVRRIAVSQPSARLGKAERGFGRPAAAVTAERATAKAARGEDGEPVGETIEIVDLMAYVIVTSVSGRGHRKIGGGVVESEGDATKVAIHIVAPIPVPPSVAGKDKTSSASVVASVRSFGMPSQRVADVDAARTAAARTAKDLSPQPRQEVTVVGGKPTCVTVSLVGTTDTATIVAIDSVKFIPSCPPDHDCNKRQVTIAKHGRISNIAVASLSGGMKRSADGSIVCLSLPSDKVGTLEVTWSAHRDNAAIRAAGRTAPVAIAEVDMAGPEGKKVATPVDEREGHGHEHEHEHGHGHGHDHDSDDHLPPEWCLDEDPSTPCNGTIIVDTHIVCDYDEIYDPYLRQCVDETEREIFAFFGITFLIVLACVVLIAIIYVFFYPIS